jgi:hypothetical protein
MPVKGYASITVPTEVHERIETIARSQGKTIVEFVKAWIQDYEDTSKLIGVLDRALASGLTPVEVNWGRIWSEKGVLPYEEIFNDKEIEFYKSAAWIRTSEYPEKAGAAQWPPTLQTRFRKDQKFTFEKVLVVSKEAWDEDEVWEWILKWTGIRSEYRNQIEVFVIREADARKIASDECLLDMGCYGKKVLGTLEISEKSDPGDYRWRLDSEVIDAAIATFELFKGAAIDLSKKMSGLAKSVRLELSSEETTQKKP